MIYHQLIIECLSILTMYIKQSLQHHLVFRVQLRAFLTTARIKYISANNRHFLWHPHVVGRRRKSPKHLDQNYKVSMNLKCLFRNVYSVLMNFSFLGFSISSVKKLAELNDFPPSNDSKSLHRFLGMTNFYRNLVSCFSDMGFLAHWMHACEPKVERANTIEMESFETIKMILTSVTALAYSNSNINKYQSVTDLIMLYMIENQLISIGIFQ